MLACSSAASPRRRSATGSEGKSTTSISHITSGRSKLVSNGLKIVEHHPVTGVGVGGFKHAYAQISHLRGKEPKAAASHTTPITVAAETGVPGLLLLFWLAGTALAVGFRRLGPGSSARPRLAFGLALTAILVHCLFYNALFEDPTRGACWRWSCSARAPT